MVDVPVGAFNLWGFIFQRTFKYGCLQADVCKQMFLLGEILPIEENSSLSLFSCKKCCTKLRNVAMQRKVIPFSTELALYGTA